MDILLMVAAAALLELLVHLFAGIRFIRRFLAIVAVAVSGFTLGLLVFAHPTLFSVVFALLGLYRILNMIRVIQERMHERYLRRSTLRTTLTLLLLQAIVVAGWLAWNQWHVTGQTVWAAVSGLQLAAAAVLLLSVIRNLRRTQWPHTNKHFSDVELPTVTIAIPARNETEDLQRCLESAIASDYPKLEIIVLDDCSQTQRTPDIIKSYAQAGVRFIQGHEPSETWLPKNQAYKRLAEESSGEYILFCGVDVRFERQSVRTLMTTLLARKKQMMCVLPERQQSAYGHLSLVQAMRYWWELVPPRRLLNRPPVLSACWIIRHKALVQAGGFAAVARSIVPEAHFARQLISSDSYSFLRSTALLGITSNKHVYDQRATAIRMRYPQLHRRPEQVALIVLVELAFLLLPFVLAVGGFWFEIGAVAQIAAALAGILLTTTYQLSVRSTRVNTWWFGLIGQPLAVITDIALIHYSMWKYEFSTVEWKGRNICIPAMHVYPHLPKLR